MLNTFNTPKYLNWNYFSISSESILDEKIKKKLGSNLLKWKWSLSFSLHWAWFVDYMIWLLGQYPWEPISWSNPYPCLIYFILRWLKMCQIPQTLRIHSKYTHYMLNTFNTPKYLNWNYFSVSSESMLDEKIKKKLGSNLFKQWKPREESPRGYCW